jgi:hypothetical protein
MKNIHGSGYFGAFRQAVEIRVHVFTSDRLVNLNLYFGF